MGVFRSKLSTDADFGAEGTETAYAPANLLPGSHTLMVQERDLAGNWSAAGSATVVTGQ